jgi:putative membrane protein insertion efficiency factor
MIVPGAAALELDGPTPPLPRGRLQRLLLAAVEAYQRAYEGRPSPCRFYPTCSSYAHQAIVEHGAGRGGWLTLRRLARCRPFGPSGFDPVPPAADAVADGDRVPSTDVPAALVDAAHVLASDATEKG